MYAFGVQEYQRYAAAQEHADRVWRATGDGREAETAQDEANALYEAYEYASGLKSYEETA